MQNKVQARLPQSSKPRRRQGVAKVKKGLRTRQLTTWTLTVNTSPALIDVILENKYGF